jgi:hypothetical protein
MAAGDRGSTGIFRIILGLIELWLLAVVLILGAAFIMGLLGANADASFAEWIYGQADNIMTPFQGIFDPIELTGETEIQTSLLFAMFIYGGIAAIIGAVSRRIATGG